ncbi:hypothetical protein [Actinoallomurus sp. CA-150999]|uniref:hypothetical protein n=1 Tax=Actinoallomurus sp. CA-150999 TaxID=3239887 RepID=UPI003D8A4C38
MHLVVEETPRSGRWFVGVHVRGAEAATVRLGFEDGRRHDLTLQPNGHALDLIPWTSDAQAWPSEALVLDEQGAITERFPWDPATHGLLSDKEETTPSIRSLLFVGEPFSMDRNASSAQKRRKRRSP